MKYCKSIALWHGKWALAAFAMMAGVVVAGDDKHLDSANERYAQVLAMGPVGYWPADQGQGDVLIDLSDTRNNGVIYHVPWDAQTQLLEFNGAYQWLEIPQHAAYQTPAFSMGGWVFLRTNVIGSCWVNREGLLLIGNRRRPGMWQPDEGVQLSIRRQEVIDVMSNGKADVLGTRLWVGNRGPLPINRSFGSPNLAIGQWHHLLYTFESNSEPGNSNTLTGMGKLFFNGELIATRAAINYAPADINLQIGNDAWWWMQTHFKSGSLDGSVRDLVWFDRALCSSEVEQLYTKTKPMVTPDVHDDTAIVMDGVAIAVEDLANLPITTRRNAMDLFSRKDRRTLESIADRLLPVLTASLYEPNCRLQAVKLLQLLEMNAADQSLAAALSHLIATVQNDENPQGERADAALALAAMGSAAVSAIPALVTSLDELVSDTDIQPPRVEEWLRNALTQALLDLDPQQLKVQSVLSRTFAKPLLAVLDLENPDLTRQSRFGELLTNIERQRYWQAMQVYRQLPAAARAHYFTFRANERMGYSAIAHHQGVTYKVGEGIAWRGAEKVPVEEYQAILTELATQYPHARQWRSADFSSLYRVPISRIDADGNKQTVYLEGADFIFDGSDEKLQGWSIVVDELGFIHLLGGQHNRPSPNDFIPGSWERMGVSRDPDSDDFPLQMYWVSREPGNIASFEFAGRRSDPRALPASYLNYMVFVQSPAGETFLYGRVDALGWQSWGLFRYDVATKRWHALGGDPYELIESARRHHPKWLDYLHNNIRGRVPTSPSDVRPLVWAWQPHFYNFCRDAWGVRFDKTGRMHIRMVISGLDGAGYLRPSSVYAWSDDGGESFYRTDGSRVKLPLTINPAPEHNAEIAVNNTLQHHNGQQFVSRQWFDLWLGLLHQVGYRE
jgi:hypothetical protein